MKSKKFSISLLLALIMLFIGCNTKQTGTSTADEITTFVDETYTEVFAAYAKAHQNNGMSPDRSVFDKKYLTERLQAQINNEEMIDADYWIQAQDFTTPVFEIQDSHVTDSNNGYVDILIRIFGADDKSATPCRIVVTKENGQWKIDEFQNIQR